MSEKKKFKFNIIDAIVLLVIVAVIAFVASNLFGDSIQNGSGAADAAKNQT